MTMKLTGNSRRDYEKLVPDNLRLKNDRDRYRDQAHSLRASLKSLNLALERTEEQWRMAVEERDAIIKKLKNQQHRMQSASTA